MRGVLPSARGGALGKFLVLLLVLGAGGTLGWMLLLPTVVTNSLTNRSGFPTEVGQLAFNPFSGRFEGGGVVVNNPGTWGGGRFLEISRFTGRVEPLSATREELVIDELEVNLDHLVIILSPEGQTNAQAYGESFAAGMVGAAPDAQRERRAIAGPPELGNGPKKVLVRRLKLRIGKVELLQPGRAGLERLSEQLDFTGNYQDVRQPQDLLSAELLGRLAKSPALWRLLLSSDVLPAGSNGSKLQQLLNQAGGALNSLFRTLEQTPDP